MRKFLRNTFEILKDKIISLEFKLREISYRTEIKHFFDMQKLKEFITSRPVLQEMLNEIFQIEGKTHRISE